MPLGLVAALAVALPAKAFSGDHADCAITGTGTATTQASGGTGTYHFSDLVATCVAQSSEPVSEMALEGVQFGTGGTFTNSSSDSSCGRGHWHSQDMNLIVNLIVSNPSGDPDALSPDSAAADLNYDIDFTAGVGSLTWQSQGTSGGGVVQIVPEPGPEIAQIVLEPGPQIKFCVPPLDCSACTDALACSTCTEDFKVAGEVSVDF